MKTSGAFSNIIVTIILLGFVVTPYVGHASTIVKQANVPVENRFVVGPAKVEVTVSAGDTRTVDIDLENRTGRTEIYTVSFEDFQASQDDNKVVQLLGSTKSNTSLRDSLYVLEDSIVLAHGDRVRIPVTISIPANETAGGKFGSVIISAQVEAPQEKSNGATAGATVVGQVATLFFVTVPGEILHEAKAESFRIARNESVFFLSPITFQIAFRNSGTTYENPYGGITIRNMFGRVVASEAIDPWFVLPQSLRTREVSLSPKNLFGFYTATLELNRGYNDVVDTKEVSFAMFNPMTLALVIIVLVVLVMFVRNRRKHSTAN